MTETTVIAALFALIILFIFFKIIGSSMKWIVKLLIHAVAGFIVLFVVNIFGGIIGITLDLNLINAIVTGILGMPGVILLLVIKYLL